MRGLDGKVAVVTGAARQRGIGRAIAMRLAEEGCDVMVTGYPRDPASYRSHIIYSDDGGGTWQLGGIHESFTNESTIAELSDGRLHPAGDAE